jgi:hypothetical protein
MPAMQVEDEAGNCQQKEQAEGPATIKTSPLMMTLLGEVRIQPVLPVPLANFEA